MNMTPVYVGIGMGVTAVLVYALYKYFVKKRHTSDLSTPTGVSSNDTSDIEELQTVDYQNLLNWLRIQYKKGLAKPGDSFVILQNANAASCLKESFPNMADKLKTHKCLLVSVKREETITSAKFFIYEELASSLVDLLPKDEETAYIQKLS